MRKLILALLLICAQCKYAVAGLPPTAVQDSLDADPVTTFRFVFPHFTGSHDGTEYTLGVNGISGGGTGQTTANAALNALLPSQTGNNGKALFTDGSNSSWQAAAGSGTVTTVTSADASIDITNPTTTPDLSLHFPISAPNGSVTAPSYRFDADTGIYALSDGVLAFTANGTQNAVVGNNGDWTFSDPVTAPDFVYPSKTQSFFLAAPNNTSGVPSFRAIAAGDIGNEDIPFPLEGGAGSAAVPTYGLPGSGIYSPSFGLLSISTLSTERVRFENDGSVNFYGDVNIVGNISAANFPTVITGSNATIAWFDSITGELGSLPQWNVGSDNSLNLSQVTDQATSSSMFNLYGNNEILGDFSGVFVNRDGNTITGNANFYTSSNSTDIDGNQTIFSSYTTGAVGADYRVFSATKDGDISNNAQGYYTNVNGNIAKGYVGFGSYTNGNIGDGTGTNAIGADVAFQGGSVNGGIFGFNFSNNTTVLGNNSTIPFNVNNQGTGYSFTGANVYNSADQTDSIVFFSGSNDVASSGRTMTGLNLNLSGTIEDDFHGGIVSINNLTADSIQGWQISVGGVAQTGAQGLSVDVSNLSTVSTSQHVQGLQVTGGVNQIFGTLTPFSGANIEIGNGFFSTSTVPLGSPLTGTDQIITLLQSNIQADDDISTGAFGLDTNMMGIVSQAVVGSGKTIPVLRSMLVGTSIPSGSGGTITEHRVIEMLGLPSFGGAVSNPTRVGLIDSNLLGQNFCDGATDCWFIKQQDPNGRVELVGDLSSEQGVKLATSGSQPACDVDHRGLIWNIENGTGVADDFQICQKDAADAYVWVSH